MDNFLTYIERYKFAILGTVLFHVVFFMATNFVTVQRPFKILYEEDITEVALETDEIEIDEKMLEMLNQQNQQNNEQLYNVASDANDTREQSYENYSTQEIDNQVENDARALEQQYFEEWAATHSDETNGVSAGENSADNENSSSQSNRSNQTDNSIDNSGNKAFAGPVMASFSLKNRNAHSLKVPGYTCNGAGTVVIDIKVDRSGNVKSADYNSSLSFGATECMINKSKQYAKRARFDFNSSAALQQEGTITYKFQGQ